VLETLDVDLQEVDGTPGTWAATTCAERPDGHLDRTELLAVRPVALSKARAPSWTRPRFDRSIGVRPVPASQSASTNNFPSPGPCTEARRGRFVSAGPWPRRGRSLFGGGSGSTFHAPPSPLSERRSDRIQYGITGTDIHPEAPGGRQGVVPGASTTSSRFCAYDNERITASSVGSRRRSKGHPGRRREAAAAGSRRVWPRNARSRPWARAP